MNLNKYLPLSETTYYIMLSLITPSHGYAIMQNVELLSDNNVKIAAGTLYGALVNLTKQKLIAPVQSKDERRKTYQLTPKGYEILMLEYKRMHTLIQITDSVLGDNFEGEHDASKT